MSHARRFILAAQIAGILAGLAAAGPAAADDTRPDIRAEAAKLRSNPALKGQPVRVPVGAPVSLNPQPIPPKEIVIKR